MLEVNSELAQGVLGNLEYLKILHNACPTLKVPLSFLSPLVSKRRYNNVVQLWDICPAYQFIFSSVCNVREKSITDGSVIFTLLSDSNDCLLEVLASRYFDDPDTEHDQLEACSMKGFINFLSEQSVHLVSFNLSFIDNYSMQVDILKEEIISQIVQDLSYVSGAKVIASEIHENTCTFSAWYFYDQCEDSGHYIDEEYVEEILLDILKNKN